MDALGLGHRGIVEWMCAHDELPCWYATATVVCCPWRDPAEAPEAAILAAAAARPFVCSDLNIFRRSFCAPNAPALLPPGNSEALVAALAPLLADLDHASRLGDAARSAVTAVFSHEAAAARLASRWSALAEPFPPNETS
jgi:glycosyltransferase involved in cell wall biosynthesis